MRREKNVRTESENWEECMMGFKYGGFSKVGFRRENNEDFLMVKEFGGRMLLAIIADGAGSEPSRLQPAQLACRKIVEMLNRVYDDGKNEELLINSAEIFLSEAVMSVNQILGAFRTANEEVYSGFTCALTCAMFIQESEEDFRLTMVHTGNTRLYLIRRDAEGNAAIRQLTKDQTEAQLLVDDGKISEEQYYFHEARGKLLCPLGSFETPKLDRFSGKIRKDFVFLMTTDGIHYAIRPEPMTSLVLENPNFDEACATLCEAAESLESNDDYGVILIQCI